MEEEDYQLDLTVSQVRAFLEGDGEADELIAGALDEAQGAVYNGTHPAVTLHITITKDNSNG